MTTQRRTVTTEWSLQTVLGEIRQAWKSGEFLRLQWSQDRSRSTEQNATSHRWYDQISRELGEGSPEDAKAFCKLHFGVAILRADDEGFRDTYDSTLKGLPYDVKMKVIRMVPITSLMSTKQLTRYLEDVQKHFANERGVQLEFKKKDEESPVSRRRVAA